MSDYTDWLPPLITLDDFGGDWWAYKEACYDCYCQDFVYDNPSFEGKPVRTISDPMREGKEESFWHVVEGRTGDSQEQCLMRCERITWIRSIIEATSSGNVKCWRVRRTSPGKRRAQKRIQIALEDFSFVVVLVDRGYFVLLLTAYPLNKAQQRRRLKKDFLRSEGC
jgi:hypothetical protein